MASIMSDFTKIHKESIFEVACGNGKTWKKNKIDFLIFNITEPTAPADVI